MSRSAPSAPGYLQGAIKRVERVLRDSHPEPMTAREVSDVLVAEGYRWPLREGWDTGTYRPHGATGDPTPVRVRRVCEIKGNRTVICWAGWRRGARLYSIYEWAIRD